MLRRFRADLHVHTCLSPCGDLEMSPQKIIAQALERRIEMVAICDHNSTANAWPVMKVAEGKPLIVLPGMEVCSQEEIHVLAIFEEVEAASELQRMVDGHLRGRNDPDVFGLQVLANENDEVVGFEEKLLIGATELSIDAIVTEIHRLGGLAIASHIDREAYSVVGQLGFIPASLLFDAVELSKNITDERAFTRFPDLRQRSFIRNSDAHFLRDIGTNASEYLLEEPSMVELARALRGEGGRRVCGTATGA